MKVLDATEIQSYFRGVADQYNISLSIQFHSTVEKVVWDEAMVTIKDRNAKKSQTRRCKVLISGVGAPSLPKECELPGVSSLQGQWSIKHNGITALIGQTRMLSFWVTDVRQYNSFLF